MILFLMLAKFNLEAQEFYKINCLQLEASSTNSNITLNWTQSVASNFESYEIYYQNTSPYLVRNFTKLVSINNVNATQYTVSNLQQGNTYYFYVAVKDQNLGEYCQTQIKNAYLKNSNETNGPQALLSISGSFGYYFEWKQSDTTNNSGYYVYLDTLPNPINIIDSTLSVSDTSVFINSLDSEKVYFVRVAAKNFGQRTSGYSNEIIDFYSPNSFQGPQGLNAKMTSGVTLSWNPVSDSFPNHYRYLIFRGINKNSLSAYAYTQGLRNKYDTLITLPASPTGVKYYYQLKAENYSGFQSSFGSIDSLVFIDTTAPNPPTLLEATGGDKNVFLRWSKYPNLTQDFWKYEVFYDTVSPPVSNSTFVFGVNDSSTVISGLQNGKTYYFRVRSYDVSNNISGFSNILNAVSSDTTGPEKVTNLSATIDSAKVPLSWTVTPNFNNDFSYYRVYRKDDNSSFQIIDTIQNINNTSFLDSSVQNNIRYFYKVVPVDTLGNEGFNNDIIKVTPTRVETELNDSWFTADPLDSAKVAFLGGNTDDDIFSFYITQPSQVTLKTDSVYFLDPQVGANITNTYIDLLDTNGFTILASNNNDPSNGNYSRIVYNIPSAGRYFVHVTNNNSGNSGYYSMQITKFEPDIYELNNNIFTATALADTQIISKLSIYPIGDKDFFKFSSVTNSRAQINIYNPFYTGTIKYYNDQNQLLNTSFGNSSSFIIPDTTDFFFSYEVQGFTTPLYNLDFKIIPPISYSDSLKITEIKYNGNVEFVEIYNFHSSSIKARGFSMPEVNFTFPQNFSFASNTYTVIAKDSTAFFNRYGFYPDLDWGGVTSLSNTSQTINLLDSVTSIIDYVTYSNGTNSFPSNADTTLSIELLQLQLNNNLGGSWKSTSIPFGTPTHKVSFPRNYSSDGFEPNNLFTNPRNIQFRDSLNISLSELVDTADFFLIRPRVGDTLDFEIKSLDTSLFPEIKIFDVNQNLVFQSAISLLNTPSFVAPSTDTFILKITPQPDFKQFVLNEGNINLDIIRREKILFSPWYEGFEDVAVQSLPNGFRVFDLDGNGQQWGVSTINLGINTSKNIELSKNTNGNNDWLILPPSYVRQDDYFGFYAKPSSTTFPEKLEIWVGNRNATNPSSFTTLLDSITVDSTQYKFYRYELSNFIGQVVRIALRGVSVNQNIIYLDNLTFSPPAFDASVRGVVKDFDTGLPVSGVEVSNGNNIVFSDTSGYYEINELPYGNTIVNFDKSGYSRAQYTFSLFQGDTISFDPILAQTDLDTFYVNPFDHGLAKGYSQIVSGSKNWSRLDSVIYLGQVITASEDDTMLVHGGNLGYNPATVALYTFNSTGGFDFSQYKTVNLTYDLNYNLDTSDGVYLLGNASFIINLNNDTLVDSSDVYTGNSQGWFTDNLDLSYLNNFNDLDLNLLFISNPFFTNGFGFAVDNIYLVGEKEIEKPKPANIYAESFLVDTIKVHWQADTSNTTNFRVFRRDPKGQFTYIGSTIDTFFNDTTVVNEKIYNYYVIASYPYGESERSDNVVARSGIPTTLSAPYSMTFNAIFSDTLPAKWAYDLSENNPWLVGDSASANTFNANFRGKSRFVYGNFFSFNVFGEYYESILTTPWYNFQNVQNNLLLSFDYSGDQTFENHVLIYKDGLASNWKILDTLQGNFRWKKYRYDLSSIAKGKPYFQLGFLYADDSTKLSTPNVGFAIDNFSLTDVKTGFYFGQVTSETGNPLSNCEINVRLRNAETWNAQTSFNTTTDSLGNYKLPQNSIYGAYDYVFNLGYYSHDSLEAIPAKLQANDSLQVNLQLDLTIPIPEIISLVNDPLGFPIISWKNPKNIGEVSYDDGQLGSYNTLSSGFQGGLLFDFSGNGNVQINQLAFYTDSVSQQQNIQILGFKVNQLGLPNTTDTLFSSSVLINQKPNAGWEFINLNQSVDTSVFYITINNQSSVQNPIKIGFSKNASTSSSIWKTNSSSNFFNTTEGIMMRAYINAGNNNFGYNTSNYQGNISVYRLRSFDPAPSKIDSNLTSTNFTDTTLNIGDTAFYYLTGNTNYGESDISNIVGFVMEGQPYLKATIGNLDLDFLFTTASLTNNFNIQNIGLDTLTYNVSYHLGLTEQHNIDTPNIWLPALSTSNLYCFTSLFIGDTNNLEFSFENLNQSGESIERLELFFPPNVRVVSSSNLNVFNSSRFLLSGGQTGDSITLSFSDPNSNGKGEINPFEGGRFFVDVVLDSGATAPVKVPFSIFGDGNSVYSDTITIGQSPFNVQLVGNKDTLATGGSQSFSASLQLINPPINGGRFPSYYRITSNDPTNTNIVVPFMVEIDPARGVFRGLVTDNIKNDPLPGIMVEGASKIDTTDATGWFYITDVPVGEYEFTASNVFYDEGSSTGKLFGQGDTSTLLITLSPRIPEPIGLTARGESNNIRLNWRLKDYELFYDMEQPSGAQSFDIKDWKTVDGDGDGFSWDYYSAAPYQGFYSIANTANPNQKNSDWLISKQLRIEEKNASFNFFASPQDFNFSEERFVVRVSKTGDDITNFTDSVYSFKFPANANQWQSFSVGLGAYFQDSIHVAIECVSNGQFKLKLDALKFTSARYVDTPLDSGVYSFKVFRSQSNSPNFSQIDSISFANDTVTFLDSTVLLDTLYTYYVTSVIPQINQNSKQSNFASFRLLSKDVGVVNLVSPVTGRNLTASEDIEIEIENLGTDSIYKSDTISVSYAINGGGLVTESFLPDTNYGPGSKINYTFNTTANLQNKATYNFQLWSNLKRDNNLFNDTLNTVVVHKPDTLLPPPWSINPSNYQFNMALTAEVYIIDTLSIDSADLLAAFSGNQVRGLANIQFVPAFGKWVAQITVYSNLAIENINFKVWDASRDSIFDILESYTFINNQIYGSLTNPEKLHTLSGSDFYDVGITKLIAPNPIENTFSNAENIIVQLENFGSLDFPAGDSILVDYKVQRKGFTLISGTKAAVLQNDFASGDTLNFNLSTTLNMSDTGVYTFSFNTKWFNDVDLFNDTLVQLVNHNPVNTPTWTVDPSKYQYSAFITARVLFDDVLSTDNDDLVAAVISNQVRGVANIQFVPAFSEYVIQMPIYSNAVSGERIQFRAFDHSKNQTLWVEEEYKFANNAIWGSLVNPERLHAVTGYNGIAINSRIDQILLYPNPSNGRFYVISKDTKILKLDIYSVDGKLIYQDTPQANFDEVILENFSGGLFRVNITTENGLIQQSLLLNWQ